MKNKDRKRLAQLYPGLRLDANTWTHHEQTDNGKTSSVSFHWKPIFDEFDLTTTARAQLASEAKEFFSWLMISLASKRRRNTIASIEHKFESLRSLLKWMASMHYRCFEDIDPQKITSFFSFRVGTRRFFSKQRIQRRTITARFQLLTFLYQFHLRRSIGLSFNPAVEINLDSYLNDAPIDQYKPLPEDVVLSHLSDAISWIHGPAHEFLDAIDQCEALKSERGIDAPNHANDYKIFREAISDEQRDRLCSHLKFPATTRIGRLLLHGRKETYGACLFIIFYMTGLRIGSLVDLSSDCITYHRHSDGISHPYLTGRFLKNQKRKHRWIANEVIVEATDLLSRISFPIRKLSGMPDLFASMKGHTILPLKTTDFCVKGARDINDLLKHFCHSDLRTRKLQRSTRIHAHQSRISFARFVGARDKSALGALAGYYGHAQDAITDDGYIGTDIDLSKILEEEGLNDLAAGLEDLISSPLIGGKASDAIRERVLKRKSFRGRVHLRAEVERMIKNGVVLAPCNYGYCLYRKTLSACKGSDNGPNIVHREPGTCSGCQNFCITEKHISWWQDRLRSNLEFLERPDLIEMNRSVAETRVVQAKNLLDSIKYHKGPNNVETKNRDRNPQKVSK